MNIGNVEVKRRHTHTHTNTSRMNTECVTLSFITMSATVTDESKAVSSGLKQSRRAGGYVSRWCVWLEMALETLYKEW